MYYLKKPSPNVPQRQSTEIPKNAPLAQLQNVTIQRPSDFSTEVENLKSQFSLLQNPQIRTPNSPYKYSVSLVRAADYKENCVGRSLLKYPRNQLHDGVYKCCPPDAHQEFQKSLQKCTQPAAGAPYNHAPKGHIAYLEQWRSNWNRIMASTKEIVLPENPKLMDFNIIQGNRSNEASKLGSIPTTLQPYLRDNGNSFEQLLPLDLSCRSKAPPRHPMCSSDWPNNTPDKEPPKHANRCHPLSVDHPYAMVERSPVKTIWNMDNFCDLVAKEVELMEALPGIVHSAAEERRLQEIEAICRQLTGTDLPAHVEVPREREDCYVLGTEKQQPAVPQPDPESTDGLTVHEAMSQQAYPKQPFNFDEAFNVVEQSKAPLHPPESMALQMNRGMGTYAAIARESIINEVPQHPIESTATERNGATISYTSTAGLNNQENTNKNPDAEIFSCDEDFDILDGLRATIPPPEFFGDQEGPAIMVFNDTDPNDLDLNPEPYASIFDYLGLDSPQMPQEQPNNAQSHLTTFSSEDKDYNDVVASDAAHPELEYEDMIEELMEEEELVLEEVEEELVVEMGEEEESLDDSFDWTEEMESDDDESD
ncbi:uncharacterized protein Dere_GG27039 [Drosophila erecta]|uniref:Uncharacterized protein n=1 Tax=Drosophila erecta TaxID=7220 RepID=A0A0Q5T3X2_DROER|nr:uncharacterized protein Dere_GG27039 [Drosophila erecta]